MKLERIKNETLSHNTTPPTKATILIATAAIATLSLLSGLAFGDQKKKGFCYEEDQREMATLGGVHESQGLQNAVSNIDDLGRFAVDEHNKKSNAMLEFARVVKAKEQVVAGTLHHLTIEAIEAGKKKLYEAKVWVKPWLNFKELQEFNAAPESHDAAPAFTSSDLGAKRGDINEGWVDVPSHDPAVQDAANHALKTIQQRSNSLFPYELQEVEDAKAEVVDDNAKFHMILKVKRGNSHEKFKVMVHKNNEGTYHLNNMELHA